MRDKCDSAHALSPTETDECALVILDEDGGQTETTTTVHFTEVNIDGDSDEENAIIDTTPGGYSAKVNPPATADDIVIAIRDAHGAEEVRYLRRCTVFMLNAFSIRTGAM